MLISWMGLMLLRHSIAPSLIRQWLDALHGWWTNQEYLGAQKIDCELEISDWLVGRRITRRDGNMLRIATAAADVGLQRISNGLVTPRSNARNSIFRLQNKRCCLKAFCKYNTKLFQKVFKIQHKKYRFETLSDLKYFHINYQPSCK